MITLQNKRSALFASIVVSALLTACATNTNDNRPQAKTGKSWQLQSAFPKNLALLGEAGVRIKDEINRRSEGALRIKLREPGALAKPLDIFQAVADGDIKIAYTRATYAAAMHPSAVYFDSVPFGAEGIEQYNWINSGEGRTLFDELTNNRIGVKALPCSLFGAEGGGWYKNPIASAEDFSGIKMRFFGLGGKVMQKLGVTLELVRGAEIYPALKSGKIDGTEFANPAIDKTLKFWKVAKHYYYPSWHARTSLGILIVNKDAWGSLDPGTQHIVEDICDENVRYWLEESSARDQDAMTYMKERGANIQQFPADVLDAIKPAWNELEREKSRMDPTFQKTSDAYQRFLARTK